jgi:catechol 2,3-dioxygenase-like lactoylglutathione lyase family enzyme
MAIALGPVHHFSLAVSDPQSSAAWWRSLFDLEEYRNTPTRVLVGNGTILIAFGEGIPDPAALTHMAFRTTDMASLEAARDELRAKGVALEDPGNEIGPVAEGSKSMGLWFRDPDGYRWELYVQAPNDD